MAIQACSACNELRPDRRAEAGRSLAGRRNLGVQHHERRAIHRHFIVRIDHAGVAPARAEHLVDDMRGAVEHRRLLREAGCAAHRAFKTNDLLDPIEAAKRCLQLSDRIERTQPKRLIALLDRQSTAIGQTSATSFR